VSKSRDWSTAGVALAAFVIAAYFISFTAGSLRTEFTHDDLMNCYRGWFHPLKVLAAENLMFWKFSPSFRPLPALIYRAFFGPFGFDLFAMRLFLWGVLAANAVLAYLFVRRLTDSRETGLLAALLICYHSNFASLYYNTGTIYDIFCYFFYLFVLVLYTFWRSRDRFPGPVALVALALLYIFALDSKELAVSLPGTILAYELLFHPPRLRGLGSWLVREARFVWVTGFITLGFIFGRMIGPDSISAQGGYHVVPSAGEYLKQAASYFGELFYKMGWFSSTKALVLLLGLLVVALALRSRVLVFGWIMFTVGFLPMAFIPPRSLHAIYLPLTGLALYFAVLLVELRGRLLQLSGPEFSRPAGQALLFIALTLFLIRVHPGTESNYNAWLKEYRQIRSIQEQYKQLYPSMPPESRVLILKDPFGQYNWASIFVIRLVYRDPSIHVDRLETMNPKPDAAAVATYNYILTFEDDRLIEIDPKYVSPVQ
jgi:Dolichyl-phosphate-mannose-protein mannosyltransferase